MARTAQLLRCLALALLASRVAAISLVVLPNQARRAAALSRCAAAGALHNARINAPLFRRCAER